MVSHQRVSLLSGVTWFISVLLSLPLWAATEATPLSRSQAMAISVTKHPRLVVYDKKIDAASARIGQARAGFMPQVSFVERYSRTNNPMWAFGTKLNQETITTADFDPRRLNDPDEIDNFVSTVDVKWPLYDSGQTWFGWRQAKKGADVAASEYHRARQEVIAGAAIAYDGLLLAMAQFEVVEQAISLAKAHFNLVEERYRAGFVVKSDLLRAQVRLADLNQRRFEAESCVAVAMAGLGAAMGEPTAGHYLPTDKLTKTTCQSASIDQWIGFAMENRPELHMLSTQEEIAQQEIKKQKSRHLPALSLFGNYEVNSECLDDTAENFTVGAMMQVNLFSGGRTVSQTREAQAALAEVRARRRDLIANIEVEVRRAFHQACSAGKRIDVARAAIDQAKENRRIVSDRYGNGLLTIVDLLDAETAIENVRNNLYGALHDYRVSYVRLELASGLLDIKTD